MQRNCTRICASEPAVADAFPSEPCSRQPPVPRRQLSCHAPSLSGRGQGQDMKFKQAAAATIVVSRLVPRSPLSLLAVASTPLLSTTFFRLGLWLFILFPRPLSSAEIALTSHQPPVSFSAAGRSISERCARFLLRFLCILWQKRGSEYRRHLAHESHK